MIAPARSGEVYTVGHSTRSIEEMIALLKAHNIQTVIDIRTIPKSRHNPQFNKEVFKKYRKEISSDRTIVFGGRLGDYAYYDIDQTIAAAMKLWEKNNW